MTRESHVAIFDSVQLPPGMSSGDRYLTTYRRMKVFYWRCNVLRKCQGSFYPNATEPNSGCGCGYACAGLAEYQRVHIPLKSAIAQKYIKWEGKTGVAGGVARKGYTCCNSAYSTLSLSLRSDRICNGSIYVN